MSKQSQLLAKSLREALASRFNGNMADFARSAGVHRNQLTQYVSGAALPSVETLIKISDGLGVSAASLLGGEVRSHDSDIEGRVAALEARLSTSRDSTPIPVTDPGKARLHDLIENLEPGEVEAAQTLLIYLFDRLEARRRKKHA